MSLKILVVDDEPDTLGLIDLTLQTAGFDVDTALSAELALQLFRQETYDLLLLDVMMPGTSGFDLVRTMQTDPGIVPPVIFLTAKNQPEDRAEGERLGSINFLIKPTTRGQLLDAIRAALDISA